MDFLDLDGKDDREIVFEVLDLRDVQRQIFRLLQGSRMTVKEVAAEVDRNRSTVQRALQDMLDKDVLVREGRTDSTVYYVYSAVPMDELKETTAEVLDEWHEEVTARL